MRMLVLGRGKTGALVADVARERGHEVIAVGRVDAESAFQQSWDVAIDFTTPESALSHIRQCAEMRKPLVVGTTGWHVELEKVKKLVAEHGSVLVWGGNFSVGVNLFYEMMQVAAKAAQFGYEFAINETHHVHKLDAPSGTALSIRKLLGRDVDISSVRAGENMGRHEVALMSDVDTITLTHQAYSRRGFALGAVKAAEWAAQVRHPGVYEFSEIFRELT